MLFFVFCQLKEKPIRNRGLDQNHCRWWLQPWNEISFLAPWKYSYDKPRQHIKKQRCHFADKGLYGQSYDFSSSHVQMWQLDHKESWASNNWCFQTGMLEKTLERPLDCKEIQPSISKEINSKYSLEGLMLIKAQRSHALATWCEEPTH